MILCPGIPENLSFYIQYVGPLPLFSALIGLGIVSLLPLVTSLVAMASASVQWPADLWQASQHD